VADDEVARVERGIRLDLIIAVCALLISTLAAGASFWQARVLQEQLGAQIWPYVTVSENFTGDSVSIGIVNDGLGPAVLRSATAAVDGAPKSNFIDILHAVLGPHLVARNGRRANINLSITSGGSGSVLRPGQSSVTFGIISKAYAVPFARSLSRLNFRICYCAIIPGKCWLSDSASTQDPKPVSACPEIRNDLLHAPAMEELLNRNF
jgi:hypothetical protein